jgi:hypothetical protein
MSAILEEEWSPLPLEGQEGSRQQFKGGFPAIFNERSGTMNVSQAFFSQCVITLGRYQATANSAIEGHGYSDPSTPSPTAPIGIIDERAKLEKTFNYLAEKWKNETSGYSWVASMVMHPAYLEIISYGEKIIPFILKDLQSKPSHWFIALKILAKGSPVKPEDAGNIKKMTEAWLAWGKANGKLS